MAERITDADLIGLLACPDPACRGALAPDATGVVCPACGVPYVRGAHVLEMFPADWRERLPDPERWDRLQANGLASYVNDPEHNLGVGDRADYLAFARFCRFAGLVLDVGCGPQPWPAHFKVHAPATRFVGVDPLVPDAPADYVQIRALGECLPFGAGVFDEVVFATSLDHMLDTTEALREAGRVVRPDGAILVWSGEKRPGAPAPTTSPDWYRALEVPDGAEDPFHACRFTEDHLGELFVAAGLRVTEREVQAIDAWRTNHFYRLAPAAAGAAVGGRGRGVTA